MSEFHLFETRVIELEKPAYDHPLVIGGFLGASLVGLISASYLIEQLDMHQVAHVRSQHIPPAAVFVGGRLRHPFRVYVSKQGNLVAVTSEVPISIEGMYEISAALLSWFSLVQAKEVVILDGIPVNGIPDHREVFCVAEEKRSEQLKAHGVGVAQSALITGMGGSILNECLTRKMMAISLLTPASLDLPDPGAALKLIQTINSVYGLNIPTHALEETVVQLDRNLKAISSQYDQMQEDLPKRSKSGTMYG